MLEYITTFRFHWSGNRISNPTWHGDKKLGENALHGEGVCGDSQGPLC